ncbi:MAG TPA: M1 family metallopeptidase [Chloroflexota bacterium]|nr:M1 family metallopeptidase [Chloroflexota bacterium]
MPRHDPHSYADASQPVADFLVWRAQVDFAERTLSCEAILRFAEAVSAGPLDLDTRDLFILSVTDDHDQRLAYDLAPAEPILGARLRIHLTGGAREVRITYRTSPDATALQWLAAAQTSGGRQPFLYTQCQPIHARSIIPLQDTPRTRLRFEAELEVPAELTPLLAAESLGQEQRGERTVARFRMPQPISPYLFAFAVGDLIARDLSPRSRVWAEPEMIDAAAYEFADTERLLATGEQLFGPYDWERYDILVLPPAFPYGGMENPRLTFLTPSIIAGDRSLVSVVAHELAHSWTGNLVSNANAEHFWLNEGGATYAERRIVEAEWGPDIAALDWALGRRELTDAMQRLASAERWPITRLRTELQGIDPDEAYTVVPYEKGALLLRAIEEAVGRPAFDAFLRIYLNTFRFGVLTTEEFVTFLDRQLPADALSRVSISAWLYEPGLPASAPSPRSARLEAITSLSGQPPTDEQAQSWTAVEWQLYLESIPEPAPFELLAELDRRFGLMQSRNSDVLEKWLVLAMRSAYAPALPRVEDVLEHVGRMKYLRALYAALADYDLAHAERLFQRNGANYHPIARQVVRNELKLAADRT